MKSILKALKRRFVALTQTKEERRHTMVGLGNLWKMKRDFQIKFLKEMGLVPESYLLDIGCGTLRGGIPLITYLENGHYFGVEARAEALDEGRKELKEANLEDKNPNLLLAPDISQLELDQKFDFAWAFSVLIHLNDDILDPIIKFVSEHLQDDGVFYANVNMGERREGNWQGFPVVWRSMEFYSEKCAKYGLKVTDIGPLKDLGHISNKESQDIQRMLKITKI